jgi:tetratricopeptide (TPR) repeat protein
LLSKDTKISQDFEDYIQRLTNSLIGTTDPKSKAIVFYEIGLAKSYWQAEASGTEEYFMKALENAKTADYERCRAASLAKLAMIEECKGNADKARNQMNLVIKIHQELGLLEELATDFCNIGMIEGNNGNFKKAVEYLEKSLKIAKEIKYDIGIAFSMCNLSAALVGAEEKDRAIELYKALQEYRSFAIPFFSYYRERIFSPEMPPIPKFFSSITGYHNLKAVEGQRIFYNFLPYFLSIKEDPIIPCGFIEAPYFLH